MLLKAVLAEDDDFFRQKLIDNISLYEGIEIVYSTDNGKDLLDVAKKIKPEIIITDIEMPSLSGIDAIKAIREDIPNSEVIFITSYSEYIKEAVQLYSFDFIEKPINTERLRETIERIKKNFVSTDKVICFKLKNSIECVHSNDLCFIEAMDRKTRVYTSSEVFISNYSMKKVDEILTNDIFYRASRSHIINLTKVHSINVYSRYYYEINFKNIDNVAYLSKTNYQEFRERLQKVCVPIIIEG